MIVEVRLDIGVFMTQKQTEQYYIRYMIDNYVCQKCYKPAIQMAHRIAKTKVNYKIYGKDIIDHNFNLCSVCSLDCNDSFNIGNKLKKCKNLVKLIKTRGCEKLTNKEIIRIIYK